jgi:hypothetical protein
VGESPLDYGVGVARAGIWIDDALRIGGNAVVGGLVKENAVDQRLRSRSFSSLYEHEREVAAVSKRVKLETALGGERLT